MTDFISSIEWIFKGQFLSLCFHNCISKKSLNYKREEASEFLVMSKNKSSLFYASYLIRCNRLLIIFIENINRFYLHRLQITSFMKYFSPSKSEIKPIIETNNWNNWINNYYDIQFRSTVLKYFCRSEIKMNE